MPIRMIREGWIESSRIDELDANSERFLLRLMLKADDFGRYHAAPQMLKSMLFPMKDDIRSADMTRCLAACEKAGLIRCYEVAGKQLLEIHRFDQRLRSKSSKFPPPAEACQTHDGQMTDTRPLEEKGIEKEDEVESTTTGRSVVDDGDDFKPVMPNEIARSMHDLQKRINSLHPSWQKRPHFAAKELYALNDNAKGWLSVTSDDWRLLAAYMDAAIPQEWRKHPSDFFQPDNRLALINMGHTSILGIADKWLRECKKNRIATGLEEESAK